MSGLSVSQGKANYAGLYAENHTIDHSTYTGKFDPNIQEVFADEPAETGEAEGDKGSKDDEQINS